MKNILILFVVLLVIAVAFIVTKPSDQQCVELMKSQVQTTIVDAVPNRIFLTLLNSVVNASFNGGKYVFRYEDHIFYKDVYISNLKIGSALFGTFIVDENLDQKLINIGNQDRERENKILQPIRNLRSALSHKAQQRQVEPVGNDIQTINNQLEYAYAQLEKLNKFHLLRTNSKKQQQLNQQEELIQRLEERKREILRR